MALLTPRERLADLLSQAEAVVWAYWATTKTIGQIVTRYRNGLTSLVYEAFNHRMDAVDMRRDMKALIRELAMPALQEGWREGGLSEADIEDEDQQWADEGVADWIAEQVQYVNAFAKDTYDASKDAGARKQILDRVELWVDALRRLGELGRAYALKSEKAYWQLGDRATHTPDCVKLSQGKPHRVQWFIDHGYTPPIHFGCGCSIRGVKSKAVIMGE